MKTKLLSTALLLAALSTPLWAADGVTVVSWGGAYQESVRKAFFEPFMKETGVKIVEEEFNGEIAKIRAMVESNNVTWDVVENDSHDDDGRVCRGHRREDRLGQAWPEARRVHQRRRKRMRRAEHPLCDRAGL